MTQAWKENLLIFQDISKIVLFEINKIENSELWTFWVTRTR